jgi:methionyl-tRNA formyltransferase
LRLIFCGTPQFAVPSLNFLLAQRDFEIAAVVTQPDRPRGRGQEISFSPVKQAALDGGVAVLQPEKIRAPEVQPQLEALSADAIVIIAYGQIIPARLLNIAKCGWINLHASLLPKYRGAAPIQWAIANGESVSGLTTMRIDAGMDTGEILLQEEMRIGAAETTPELAARMAEAGAPLVAATLRGLLAGTITPRAQDRSLATLAPLLKKEDGRIDWSRPAREIYDRMRGFAPWPGAFTTFRGRNCQVWGEPEEGVAATGEAGDIFGAGMFLVRCGAGTALRLTHVKPEGGSRMLAVDFAHGARPQPGERFV